MKILYAPYNIASMPAITARAVSKLGHKAVVLNFGTHKYLTENEHVISINTYPRKKFFKWLVYSAKKVFLLRKYIKWADIIHWHYNITKLELALIKLYNKPAVIEWCGSEIRVPEMEFEDNPYYTKIYENEAYEYKKVESKKNSLEVQIKFKNAGFYPLLSPVMSTYVDKNIFPEGTFSRKAVMRIDIENYKAVYPSADNNTPVIVHTPSATSAKGTIYINEVLERLKKEYDFKYIQIYNMPREKALQAMQQCDIMIDQIIIGHHGMAATEAMAYGKPVVCFIKDSMKKNYPGDLPIVNANPDTLYEKLRSLLADPALRNELGKKGRAYVEKYHNDKMVASELIKVYEMVIEQHKKKHSKK